MLVKRNLLKTLSVIMLLWAMGTITDTVTAASIESVDLLIKENVQMEDVRQELITEIPESEVQMIPELKIVRITAINKEIEKFIVESEKIEASGTLPDIFPEGEALIERKDLLEKGIQTETLSVRSKMNEFELLDVLAWYKDKLTEDKQSLEIATGTAVKIGLIDSGIDFLHPLLSPIVNMSQAKSFTEDSSIYDATGHGTMVAGVITQIAPDAYITPYKVMSADGGESFWTLEAIVAAVNDGQEILNMSLGAYKYETDESEQLTILAFQRAIDYALSRNVTVIASSGNKGLDLDKEFEKDGLRHLPGTIAGVLTVSALSVNDELATYSNIGSNIRFSAPGGEYAFIEGMLDSSALIYTTYPTDRDNMLGALGLPQGYMFSMGTSLAAPCVTAGVADYFSHYKKMNGSAPDPNNILVAFSLHSLDLGLPGYDTTYGYGLPQLKKILEEIPDTVAPEGEFIAQTIEVHHVIEASELVENVRDNSEKEVSIYFDEPVASNLLGVHETSVILEDTSNNKTKLTGPLTIVDTTPPTGTAKSVTVKRGETVRPEQFVEDVQDNFDTEEILIKFVNGAGVNTGRVGEFSIKIRLADSSNNETIVGSVLTVVENEIEEQSKNEGIKEIGTSQSNKKNDVRLKVDTDQEGRSITPSGRNFPQTSEKQVSIFFTIFGSLLVLISCNCLMRHNVKHDR